MSDFKNIITTIASIQNQAELEDFLVGITTPKERLEMGQRLAIIEKLLNQETQHSIAKDLGVGVATVTRGSKELQAGRFKALRNTHV